MDPPLPKSDYVICKWYLKAVGSFPEAAEAFPEVFVAFLEAVEVFPVAFATFPEVVEAFPEAVEAFFEVAVRNDLFSVYHNSKFSLLLFPEAELLQLNQAQFPSLGIFVSKKVGDQKN